MNKSTVSEATIALEKLEENNEWKIIHCHFSPTKLPLIKK